MKERKMTQKESKYIAVCFLSEDKKDHNDSTEVIWSGDTINELLDYIELWFDDYADWCNLEFDTIIEAHHIDNTICINDFQFLIYKREGQNAD
jgi:hypothetical protein